MELNVTFMNDGRVGSYVSVESNLLKWKFVDPFRSDVSRSSSCDGSGSSFYIS